MKIFLDFDDTIFNSKKFKEDYLKLFLKNDVTKKEFADTYTSNCVNQPFRFYDLTLQLSRLEEMNKDVVSLKKDLDVFLNDLSGYVFKDFFDFAKKIGRDNLFLVSFGSVTFQGLKVEGAGVASFFKKIIITQESKGVIVKKILSDEKSLEEESFLLDDRLDQLDLAIKDYSSVTPIRVRRKEGRYSNLEKCNFREIGSLSEF